MRKNLMELRAGGKVVCTAENTEQRDELLKTFRRMVRKQEEAKIVFAAYDDGTLVRSALVKQYRPR